MKLEWKKYEPTPMNMNEVKSIIDMESSMIDSWRLPTRSELVKAFDDRQGGFFPSTHWSSTEYYKNLNFYWGVNFSNGNVKTLDKESLNLLRLCREVN
jgi:hypothetical protein